MEIKNEKLIYYLREIRDKAWQFGRCHEKFSTIEFLAEKALLELGINDKNLGNPRKPNAPPNKL